MVIVKLSRPLEIIENYGELWSLCPYNRSYPFYLQVITSLSERLSQGRILPVVSSRRYHRRGATFVREKGETGSRRSSPWAYPLHSRTSHQKNHRGVGRASWFSAPDHPLARTLPRHVTRKYVTGRESKKTKTTTVSNGLYGEDQMPERTV